jgi:hypothetical protein
MRPLWSVGFVLFAVSYSSAAVLAQQPGPEPGAFALAVSSNRFSYLEPNGCSAQGLGGFDRECNLLRVYKTERPRRRLFYLATGTTLVIDPNSYVPSYKPRYLARASVVVAALNLVGANYYAPSINDLSLGLDNIANLRKRAKFKFLSANLARINGGDRRELLFDAYDERTWNGVHVLVIGLSEKPDTRYDIPADVVLIPAEEALRNVFSQAKTANTFVIVACSLHEDERSAVLKAFPNIHFVAGGSDDSSTLDVEALDRKHLYTNPGPRGRVISIVELAPKLPLVEFFSEKGAFYAQDRQKFLEKELQRTDAELRTTGNETARRTLMDRRKRYVEFLDNLKSTFPAEAGRSSSRFESWTKGVSGEFETEEARSLAGLRAKGATAESLTSVHVVEGASTGAP